MTIPRLARALGVLAALASPSIADARQDPTPFDTDLTPAWWSVTDGTCPVLTFVGWDAAPGDPGIEGTVFALDSAGPYVFAGGQFAGAGNVAANNVARWDGLAWSDLTGTADNGVNGTVYAVRAMWSMGFQQEDVMVGGGLFDSSRPVRPSPGGTGSEETGDGPR